MKEQSLPSVLFVQNKQRYLSTILFKLCDFSVANGYANIRDGVRLLLKLLPTDPELQGKVKKYVRINLYVNLNTVYLGA